MMKNAKGIMVFCQLLDGKIAPVSRQLLGKGLELAKKRNIPLMAAFVGSGIAEKAAEAAGFGAEKIYMADHPALKHYTSVHYSEALKTILECAEPEILLVGATQKGRDLAARTAVKMGTGLTADCTMLEIQEESGRLLQTRPAYGGRVTATIICPDRPLQMATVREGVFSTPEASEKGICAEIVDVSDRFYEKESGIKVKEMKRLLDESGAGALDKAEIVVAGGRGMKDAEGMKLVKALADALGGTAAASRGAVEDGLADAGRQIGQTGKNIRPKLYIACGISGASQHLAGVEGAEKIFAINSDANAPIMQRADYVLCADVFEAIPQLIRIAEECGKKRNVL